MSDTRVISPRTTLVGDPASAKGWYCGEWRSVGFFYTGTPENACEWFELDLEMRTQAGRPEEELAALRNEISRRRSALPSFPEKSHV